MQVKLYHKIYIYLIVFLVFVLGHVVSADAPSVVQNTHIQRCSNECDDQNLCLPKRLRCLEIAFPLVDKNGPRNDTSDLWRGVSLTSWPGQSTPLPTMMGQTSSCRSAILLGAAFGNSSGVVVEMGTWLGSYSVCVAAGLAVSGSRAHYYGYDYFKFTSRKDGNMKKMTAYAESNTEIQSISDALSYEHIWLSLMHSVYPSEKVHTRSGMIGKNIGLSGSDWNNEKVPLFIIDSAKGYNALFHQSKAIWPYLRPGSIIVLHDFFFLKNPKKVWLTQPGLFYGLLVPQKKVKFLWMTYGTSSVAFEMTSEYNPNSALELIQSYGGHESFKERINMWDTYISYGVRDLDSFADQHDYRGKEYSLEAIRDLKTVMQQDKDFMTKHIGLSRE